MKNPYIIKLLRSYVASLSCLTKTNAIKTFSEIETTALSPINAFENEETDSRKNTKASNATIFFGNVAPEKRWYMKNDTTNRSPRLRRKYPRLILRNLSLNVRIQKIMSVFIG
tara:strand:+ start:186 stop:524 length:339 start_codon:yes stop_codon:yes gene_type:complete